MKNFMSAVALLAVLGCANALLIPSGWMKGSDPHLSKICNVCNIGMNWAINLVQRNANRTEQVVIHELDQLCGLIFKGQHYDECQEMVSSWTPAMVENLFGMTAMNACKHIRLCPAEAQHVDEQLTVEQHVHRLDKLPAFKPAVNWASLEKNFTLCDSCLEDAHMIQEAFADTSRLEAQLIGAASRLCGLLPLSIRHSCSIRVQLPIQQLFKAIHRMLVPQSLCQHIHLCPANTNAIMQEQSALPEASCPHCRLSGHMVQTLLMHPTAEYLLLKAVDHYVCAHGMTRTCAFVERYGPRFIQQLAVHELHPNKMCSSVTCP